MPIKLAIKVGEELNWTLSLPTLLVQASGSQLLWGSPQAHKAHRGGYHVQVGSSWYNILMQSSWYQSGCGGPCQKALLCRQLWWNFDDDVWWIISSQGPGYLCKTRWGLLLLCDGAPQWHLCPLAGNGWWSHHKGGVSGLWLPPTMGHYKITLGVGPSAPTVASFLEGSRFCGFSCPRRGYLTQFDGAMLPKTSLSVNVISNSIASLSSHTHSANWHGSLALAVRPFPPSAAMPWHTPKFSVVASCGSPNPQIVWCQRVRTDPS